MTRIVHHNVVSLEVIVEEERSQVVKKIDLQALGAGKAISFAVEVQTETLPRKPEDSTPEVQPVNCSGCFQSLSNCICEGTRFA